MTDTHQGSGASRPPAQPDREAVAIPHSATSADIECAGFRVLSGYTIDDVERDPTAFEILPSGTIVRKAPGSHQALVDELRREAQELRAYPSGGNPLPFVGMALLLERAATALAGTDEVRQLRELRDILSHVADAIGLAPYMGGYRVEDVVPALKQRLAGDRATAVRENEPIVAATEDHPEPQQGETWCAHKLELDANGHCTVCAKSAADAVRDFIAWVLKQSETRKPVDPAWRSAFIGLADRYLSRET